MIFAIAAFTVWFWFLRPPSGLRGIDVSHYQGTIDWPRVKADGIVFAFIKASEGQTLVDAQFKQNWKAARKAGVVRGAYHFYRPSVDAEVQARLFLKQFKLEKGDLPPVLDLEVTDGQSAKTIREGALEWMRIVEKKTGRKPILYTLPRFARDYLGKSFKDYPLWVVRLRRGEPKVGKIWKKWTFWQFSHRGRVDGIKGDVDLNLFNGGIEELRAFCGPQTP